MIGTPEYQLAEFLDAINKSCIPPTNMLKLNEQTISKSYQQFSIRYQSKAVVFDS